jgi:hypothetical protein
MYQMRYGEYQWHHRGTYEMLSRNGRTSKAELTDKGGKYTGWYFYEEEPAIFNLFM